MRTGIVITFVISLLTAVRSHGGSDGGGARKKVSTVVTYDTLALKLNDTKWAKGRQWYLTEGDLTHNVLAAWSNCLRGSRDVTVTVIGDGVYHASTDIKPNYNSGASYNLVDGNDDPSPAADSSGLGTRAAALIAAATNTKCGVGVAFNTSVAGIRFNYEDAAKFDQNLADALTKRLDESDVIVSSVSTGKNKVGDKTRGAVTQLLEKGRSGRGAILFWPVDVGGASGASCYGDVMVNDVGTINVAPINKKGVPLRGAPSCGALLASAYSKEAGSADPVVTISGDGQCVEDFSGAVPAAAIGAGITALVLQARPELTWRDVQHLIVDTANPAIIKEPYVTNKAGRKVSDRYGFGLLDAHAITNRARTWPLVDKPRVCHVTATISADGDYSKPFTLNQTKSCTGDQEVKYVEHVTVKVTASDVTSNVTIDVTSPLGTTVRLVPGTTTLNGTAVLTVAFWSEETGNGTWKIEFGATNGFSGKLTELVLTVRGTVSMPGGSVTSGGGGYATVTGPSENACPVLGPFQTQRSNTTDFTPLWIFIVLVLVVLGGLVLVVVYKKYLRERIECRGCGPGFREVPQNGDTSGVVEA